MYEDLQPLRVSAGWKIDRNLFFDEEIDPENMDTLPETLFNAFSEGRYRVIDLEWIPETLKSGCFRLSVVNVIPVYNETTKSINWDYDYDSPYYELQTTDRKKVVSEIERLMWQTPPFEDERILKGPGQVDEPSESFRLALKNEGLNQQLFEDIMSRGNRSIQNILIDHPDIQPDMLRAIIASDAAKKVRKKAEILLNSKRYKKAHGLWTQENPTDQK